MGAARLVDAVDQAFVRRVGERFAAATSDLDTEAFLAQAVDGWPDTLAARLSHVADALEGQLPSDRREVLDRVIAALPVATGDDEGFDAWPIVELVGRGTDDPDRSLGQLRELGAKTYPELGVRPFLLADLHGTLAVLQEWTADPRPGVRRLASEASRPRLPWAPVLRELVADPSPTLPILTALRDDPDHLTRNSVANHLNDISKDHPDVVLEVLEQWLSDATEQRRWIASRALRTLTKVGDERALALLGLGPISVEVETFDVDDPSPAIGDTVRMHAAIRSRDDILRQVRVETAVHYLRPAGGTTRKVFAWADVDLAPGERWEGSRTQHFHDLSTRTHQPGSHQIDLLVNGRAVSTLDVALHRSPTD